MKPGVKQKVNQWDLIKFKTFAHQRKPSKKQKGSLLTGRKYLQIV